MSNEYAIEVNNVSKVYKLYDKPIDRLKEAFSIRGKSRHKEFYALDSVDFKVKRGESIGIVGKNGSGKSTLLKIITGVLSPSAGNVNVNGKVSALLELGTGFNNEYTGLENIYLTGTIMGYTKEEMDKKVPEIIEFADLGDFIHQPVKTYSSGMYVRLAFAVSINVDPDILIVDEALSVGDIRFQRKCFRKIEEFKKTKTFILVSHDMSSITKFCDRVVWINEGVVKNIGDPLEITKEFRAFMIEAKFNADELKNKTQKIGKGTEEFAFDPISNDSDVMGDGKAKIEGYLITDGDGNKISVADSESKINVMFKVKVHEDIDDAIAGFTFKDKMGNIIFQTNTFVMEKKFDLCGGNDYVFKFSFTVPKLIDGYYTISPAIASGSQSYHVQHSWIFDAAILQVLNRNNINLEGFIYVDDADFELK